MVSLCGRGFDSHQVHFLISKEILSNRKGSFEAWFETAFFNSIIIEPISDSSQKRSEKLLKREELITPYYHNKFNFVLLSHLTFIITALFINALTHHFEWQKWQESSFLSNCSFGAVTESNMFLPNNSLQDEYYLWGSSAFRCSRCFIILCFVCSSRSTLHAASKSDKKGR